MSNLFGQFFQELSNKKDRSIKEIEAGTEREIKELLSEHEKHLHKIKKMYSHDSFTNLLVENYQKELTLRKFQWKMAINNEKQKIISGLLEEIKNSFHSFSDSSDNYRILVSLYKEAKEKVGENFRIHIPKNTKVNEFKKLLNDDCEIIADLNQYGIIIECLDIPLTIVNTLDSRLEKLKTEIKIGLSKLYWGDIELKEEFYWKIPSILDILEQDLKE